MKKGTKTNYNTTLTKLKLFRSNGTLPFNQVNVEFCEKFNVYLSKLGISQNTRSKYFQYLKKAVNEAIKRGLLKTEESPFNKGFKVKYSAPKKKSLSLNELKQIEKTDVHYNSALQRVKDMFLFSCYTGLRFGDLIKLSFENFIEKENEIHIQFVQEKTLRPVKYNLSKIFLGEDNVSKPEKIIRKYFSIYEYARNAPAGTIHFFNDTNQNYNRLLKDIGRIAETALPLQSHVARHTCITILVNEAGIPIQDVQKIAGHAKIETTMGYLKHDEKEVNKSLSIANWNF
ncbi:tyrosine-type recombinase/integrase [Crocinitomix catalasitica]|uniref:tyrosine-type recombinase/integrase n=1 Tax=Crocinitomix catalasitica TaxID=184607 RepID=UPI000485C3C6